MSRPLRTKLLFAQLPLGLALVVVGSLAVTTIDTLGHGAQNILKDNHQSVLAAQRMRETLDELQLDAPDIASIRKRFEAELLLQEGNITEVGEAEITQAVREQWQSVTALLAEFPARRSELAPALTATLNAINRVLAVNQDAMVRKSEHARALAEQRRAIMLSVVLAAVLLGLYASSSLTRRLLSPLTVLTLAAKRLGSGDFVARARVQGDDEIAQLAQEFNTMASHLSDYRNSSLGDLLQAQRSAQAVIDSLLDPVLLFAADGHVTGFNEHAEATLKLRPDADDVLLDVEPALKVLVKRVVTHVLSGKGPYTPRGLEEAVSLQSTDGERFLLPRATPIYSEAGAVEGVTLVLQDVTRLHRFDALKTDLVATVAHELRTPLTSLHMAVHLCLEERAGPLTDRQIDLLETAKQDCQRLQTLVDDLLQPTRIQNQPRGEAMSIRTLVDESVERHARLATEKGVILTTTVSPFLPQVLADRERVSLIFDNLLVNALRHSPIGRTVELAAQIDGSSLRVTVSDQGNGIAPEDQERVFEKFFRVSAVEGGSAGLGLYIARQAARSGGGDLWVDSEIGKGSVFSFTLPLAPEPA